MPVRKTESRLPPNFQAAEFGEAVIAPDGRCALVSFVTAPIVVQRENVYVLFVTDASLAEKSESFQWIFIEAGSAPRVETTKHGEISYLPRTTGTLDLTVRILDSANNEQTRLTLSQDVVPLNPILEKLIASASASPGPGVANPEVTRELVNHHSPYYQGVTLQTAEPGDGFHSFLFSMVFDGALQRTASQRKEHMDKLAGSLNGREGDFPTLAAQGVGVCAIRLTLAAMTLEAGPDSSPRLLDWTELPELASKRAVADEQLRERLAALDETARIDLFNVTRFSKSNITLCGRILEVLRDRYFAGTNFNDVLTGMSGTRAQRIVQHYQEGPLLRS